MNAAPLFQRPVFCSFLLFTAGLLLFSNRGAAQEVVVTNASSPGSSIFTPAEINALQSDRNSVGASEGGTLTQTPRRFQYAFSVTSRGVYDDNVTISSFDRKSDFYFTIEPSLFLGLGGPESINTLSLTYRPSLYVFEDNSQFDTVQHLIQLQGSHIFGKLSLAVTQNIQILDGPDLNSLSDPTGHNANIDVGGRTRHDIFTTGLSGSYQLTGKLFLSGAGNITIDKYVGPQIGSETYSGNLFLNYNYSEKMVVGLGGTLGYDAVENSSPDQTYEQVNFRLGYDVTAKVDFNATVGGEIRQFDSNNARGTYFSPVYAIGATYQPFDGTSLSLSGSRHTSNSAALAGQDYAATDIHFGIAQRFMQRASLGLAVGYENADYFSAISGLIATRNDDYYYVQPSVDVSVTRYWTIGAYYLHREDQSTFGFFSFYDNQVGFRTSISF